MPEQLYKVVMKYPESGMKWSCVACKKTWLKCIGGMQNIIEKQVKLEVEVKEIRKVLEDMKKEIEKEKQSMRMY